MNELTHEWQTPSLSGPTGGNCVRVRRHKGNVQIGDSKDPEGPTLTFTEAEYSAFTGSVRNGELTLPTT